MFLLTSIYTLHIAMRSEGSIKHRHMTIGFFGIAIVVLVVIQIFYPLMPFFAMGYMIGTCVLHSFVVEDEKEEYRKELEKLAKESKTDVDQNSLALIDKNAQLQKEKAIREFSEQTSAYLDAGTTYTKTGSVANSSNASALSGVLYNQLF